MPAQSLFNRANDATIEQADLLLDVGRADLEAAEQDLIVRVAQAYFDVLAAQDSLAAEQANMKAISEQLASAKRNFEVGTATITDTREAQARFDLATAQEIVAENDLQTKRIALDQLVGRTGVHAQAAGRARGAAARAVRHDVERLGRRSARRLRRSVRQRPPRPTTSAQLETEQGARRAPAHGRRLGRLWHRAAASRSASHRRQHLGPPAQQDANIGVSAEPAAVRRLRGAEPHQGNPAARRAVAQQPRGRAPHRRQQATRRLPLRRAVAAGAGEGARSGRSLEPAGARSHPAGLQGRRARQPRRAECADPALQRPARPGQGALRRAGRRAAGCARPRASSSRQTWPP